MLSCVAEHGKLGVKKCSGMGGDNAASDSHEELPGPYEQNQSRFDDQESSTVYLICWGMAKRPSGYRNRPLLRKTLCSWIESSLYLANFTVNPEYI
jgi:hypothetical protein